MRRQCLRAASASAGSHSSGPAPAAARAWLASRKSICASGCTGLSDRPPCAKPFAVKANRRPANTAAERALKMHISDSTPHRRPSRGILQLPMGFFNSSFIHSAGKGIRNQPLAVAGVVLLAGFLLAGLTAPWLAPQNPAAIDLLHRLQSPSPAHWAGTDELGRDILSRLLWGARLSLAVSASVVAVSLRWGWVLADWPGTWAAGWTRR